MCGFLSQNRIVCFTQRQLLDFELELCGLFLFPFSFSFSKVYTVVDSFLLGTEKDKLILKEIKMDDSLSLFLCLSLRWALPASPSVLQSLVVGTRKQVHHYSLMNRWCSPPQLVQGCTARVSLSLVYIHTSIMLIFEFVTTDALTYICVMFDHGLLIQHTSLCECVQHRVLCPNYSLHLLSHRPLHQNSKVLETQPITSDPKLVTSYVRRSQIEMNWWFGRSQRT